MIPDSKTLCIHILSTPNLNPLSKFTKTPNESAEATSQCEDQKQKRTVSLVVPRRPLRAYRSVYCLSRCRTLPIPSPIPIVPRCWSSRRRAHISLHYQTAHRSAVICPSSFIHRVPCYMHIADLFLGTVRFVLLGVTLLHSRRFIKIPP
ncbi:hypothetical protein Tcan_00120 [Toxocara canis]|uniref:Uncharacterized protein n=1 Tax=Toxocara canis TaxID=6265 RepID=A0A0B2VMP8_TOXCA|nr:hypothetical protein Tcan_00120 [Toxocara canis]